MKPELEKRCNEVTQNLISCVRVLREVKETLPTVPQRKSPEKVEVEIPNSFIRRLLRQPFKQY